jgi:aminoglycoside phosphotransferase (APT) family kinase protein
MPETSSAPEDEAGLDDALRRLGLLDSQASACWTPLTGGVSSDIWRVDLPDRSVCVKRARAVLAVEAEWHAPVERNAFEVAWLEAAGRVAPDAVPHLIGHLPDAHLFVMEYLEPSRYPLWKSELAAGHADDAFAASVGSVLGNLHAGFAGDAELAERFATDDLFHSLRIEPYLLRTAEAHPDLAPRLEWLADRTANNPRTLVHGDVSPKNLLNGPKGPVFLDAECAWYGDPAFDVAFCLTHLLLKCRWVPAQSNGYLACFDAFRLAHSGCVSWEAAEEFEARVAALLPALLLARVDGKSPVDYLKPNDRDVVRRVSRRLLSESELDLGAVRDVWLRSLIR